MNRLKFNVVIGLLGLSVLAECQQRGLHPINNMCERWYHQSTIKNDTLYIFGGDETFVDINNQGNITGNITKGFSMIRDSQRG